jgi:tRNA 2-thiouridine synthesizing protein E
MRQAGEVAAMTATMDDVLHPKDDSGSGHDFPNAPPGWSPDKARELARQEGLELDADHWMAIRGLQEYFARAGVSVASVRVRELRDALDEKFHVKGGYRHLYRLFPGGPIAQGCRLAGLEVPPGSVDPSFGSVR